MGGSIIVAVDWNGSGKKDRRMNSMNSFEKMEAVIAQRRAEPQEGSYTCYLFEKGLDKILKKVGEEAAETIIASKNNNGKEVLYEMSDLWYHCLVLLAYHNINPAELLNELGGRRSKENNSKY